MYFAYRVYETVMVMSPPPSLHSSHLSILWVSAFTILEDLPALVQDRL